MLFCWAYSRVHSAAGLDDGGMLVEAGIGRTGPTLRNPLQGGLQCEKISALLFARCCFLGSRLEHWVKPSAAKHLNTSPWCFECLLFVFVACLTTLLLCSRNKVGTKVPRLSVNVSAGTWHATTRTIIKCTHSKIYGAPFDQIDMIDSWDAPSNF